MQASCSCMHITALSASSARTHGTTGAVSCRQASCATYRPPGMPNPLITHPGTCAPCTARPLPVPLLSTAAPSCLYDDPQHGNTIASSMALETGMSCWHCSSQATSSAGASRHATLPVHGHLSGAPASARMASISTCTDGQQLDSHRWPAARCALHHI
jgi:hypothetical protein